MNDINQLSFHLQSNLLFSDGPVLDNVGLDKEKEPVPSTSGAHSVHTPMEVDTPIRDDGFGGNLDQNIICRLPKFFIMQIKLT